MIVNVMRTLLELRFSSCKTIEGSGNHSKLFRLKFDSKQKLIIGLIWISDSGIHSNRRFCHSERSLNCEVEFEIEILSFNKRFNRCLTGSWASPSCYWSFSDAKLSEFSIRLSIWKFHSEGLSLKALIPDLFDDRNPRRLTCDFN